MREKGPTITTIQPINDLKANGMTNDKLLRRLERRMPAMLKRNTHNRAASADESPPVTAEERAATPELEDVGSPISPQRQRSHTVGSIESDLHRKRSGSVVHVLNGIRRKTTDSESAESLKVVIQREEDDTPISYATRLLESEPLEAAAILSETDDGFTAECLKVLMDRFDFQDQPLDVALRRFLFEFDLPKETQQVDRVLNAFSKRFYNCNEDVWNREDQVYFLTFSLLLLQTDHFNNNNKHKMTKDEFVRNTRVIDDSPTDNSQLSKEFLDYFYDNITHTKFIQRSQLQQQSQSLYLLPKRLFSSGSSTNLEQLNSVRSTSISSSSTTTQFFQSSTDPYLLIITDQLDLLKLTVDPINSENPFLHQNRPSFSTAVLSEVRGLLTSNKYIAFDRDYSWLPGNTEVHVTDNLQAEFGPTNEGNRLNLCVIKIAELFKEQIVPIKFFALGGPRAIWKRCYGILTLCGLFLLDSLDFLAVMDRERLLMPSNDPQFVNIPNEQLNKCSKLALNGLFAAQVGSDDSFVFNIFSTNKKELFCASSFESMSSWIVAINDVAALDGCHRPYEPVNMEVLPLRTMRLEEKVTKLMSGVPGCRTKIDELLVIERHLKTCAPFSSRTREMLVQYHRSLGIRVDWLWYEVERNEVYINLLLYEEEEEEEEGWDDKEEVLLENSFIQ